MKKFTLYILIISIASLVKAGNLPLDFETGTYTFTNFDGGAVTVINNPQSSGINTSTKVARMVKNSGQNWAGSLITLDNAIDFSTGKTFKMKVFVPKPNVKVLLKVENATDGSIFYEKEVTTTLTSQWEELSFDYSGIDVSKTYRKVVIIFELGTVGDGSPNFTYLFDDILLAKGDVNQDKKPTTSAPTPPVFGPQKVISIFSDAFTDLDGTNFNPYWQQSTVGTIEDLLGGKVLKLKNLNYQGIELAQEVNAAAMVYLHIDVWTSDETLLDIYPISRTTGERKASLKPLIKNEWNSFDIKLSDLYYQGFNLADLFQFKFVGSGGKTVYIDNLYLYNDNPTPDTESPQNFTATVSTITYNSIKLLLKATDNSGAVNYTINVGGINTIVGAASGVEKAYEFTRLPSSTSFTFSIKAEDPSGNGASNNPVQVSAKTNEAFPQPEISSPLPPTRNPQDVISIFSNSYTNIAGTNFNPNWQQSTWYASMFIGENEMVKYENFNYQGIEIGSKVNASGLKYLHIDVWTPNESSLSISPVSQTTGEKSVKLTPLRKNEWNSYDIDLTSFTIQGMSMADILHLKLVGSGKSIIYVDNIYFYRESTTDITDIKSKTEIRLYPNPVLNALNVESIQEIRNIEIRTLTGQLVKNEKVNTFNGSIDFNEIMSGNYVVVVTLENGERAVKKIVKL
jgi:hypothetical protein